MALKLVGKPVTRKATKEELEVHRKGVAKLRKKEPEKKKKTIRLGKPKEKEVSRGREILLKAAGPLASTKTTVVLASVLAAVSGAAYLKGAIAVKSGSLIGRTIPKASIEAAGKAAGLSKAGIQQVKHAIGVRRVSEVANSLINPKSTSLMQNVLKKTFSGKALGILGTAAGTIFLGKWGQAEAGEPISIIMKDVLREAQKTGDYTLYDEAKAARDELTDLSAWEQILSNTPFISPFIGIPNKIKGVKQAGAIMDELAKQQQISAETGESEDEKWARIDKEREDRREAERIEDEAYYEKVQEDIAEAKADARKEDERYWADILREREEYEKSKREAEEKYWEDVRKLNAELKKEETKQYQDYTRSNLNFGLL